MSQAQIECQGLWHLSKYRLQEQHPGISLVFIRRVGKPAVLGQHSRRITQICSVWHQVAARQHKSFHSSIINLTVTVEDFVCYTSSVFVCCTFSLLITINRDALPIVHTLTLITN